MRLILVDPAHFHAALLLREMYPCVDPRVEVFAPIGPEVVDCFSRVKLFNSRPTNPTRWELRPHLGQDFMAKMLVREPVASDPAVAVFAGRNRPKIDRILGALRSGMHVLADKPWIISSADLPKLEEALALADRGRLIAYDIMTERYEVTSQLQREFVGDREIFGSIDPGSADSPGMCTRSVHHLMKMVAGMPLRRPPWFFDIEEYGEALADVGTHVVDLVEWTAFADAPRMVDPAVDIRIVAARRWPLRLSPAQFQQVTGVVRDGDLDYFCNNWVHYTWRGVHVQLEIVWNWEAAPGAGDVYEASFRGTRARAEIRQGQAEGHIPELYLVPAGASLAELCASVRRKVADLQTRWPGVAAVEGEREVRLSIPPRFRVGHESHFAQVAARFFEYVQAPETLPAWERPNMIAKYTVTTGGVEVGQASAGQRPLAGAPGGVGGVIPLASQRK
ncbi:MAG: putative oxidoreductase C-terminal domain-containing protein [Bryobacteraceae bacterium]